MNLRSIKFYLLASLFLYSFVLSESILDGAKQRIKNIEKHPDQISIDNKVSTESVGINTPELSTIQKKVSDKVMNSKQMIEASSEPEIFNFTVPKNTTKPCLKVIMAASFNILYNLNDGTNQTLKFNLQDLDQYTGECAEEFNLLEINFRKNWILKLNYTLNSTDKTYFLDTIKLDYMIDSVLFPNVSTNDIGRKSAELNNNTHYSTKVGNSYRCISNQTLVLNDHVTMEISNYHAQPFIKFDTSTKDFDTAVNCTADIFTSTKLIPIIVGSALVILVVLVLVAYIIGRRKHRPGYQQV